MKWLLVLLLIWSCSTSEQHDENFKIPQTYTLKSSSSISVVDDVVYFDQKLYQGYLYELYPNSQDTVFLESYHKGVLHGVCQKWHSNGQLAEKRIYKFGEKNGSQISYWDHGGKRFQFNAKNDAYEGEMKEWNIDGQLIHLANFENGQEEGTQKMWYDNGKIRANYVIKEGKRYGLLGTKNCTNVSDSVFATN